MLQTAKAIPFIIFSDEKGFQITEEAKMFLANLQVDKLGIITIVGKYRTGKSFFINSVLLNSFKEKNEKGFAVGPTINPCTKGIWIWNQLVKAKEFGREEDLDVLIMDTEGFGGIDEDTNHDTRIFLFAILLSSFFIFNSLGSIDENALQALSLIVNLAKDIRIKNDGTQSEEDIRKNFPFFFWVVRDFMLSLENKQGKQMSSKEYLDFALEEQKGVSDQIQGKNKIRKMIKFFFQERDCMTFVRPVQAESDLKKLDQLDIKFLRVEFLEQIGKAQKKIFKKIQPKMVEGQCVNGEILLEAAEAYVKAVNEGSIPSIESAWTYIQKQELKKNVRNCLKLLPKVLIQIEEKGINFQQDEWSKEIKNEIYKIFKQNLYGSEKERETEKQNLNDKIDEELKQIFDQKNFEFKKQIQSSFDSKFFLLKQKLIANEIIDFQKAQEYLEELKNSLFDDKNQQQKQFIETLLIQKEKEILTLILSQKKKFDLKKEEEERVIKNQLKNLNEEHENAKKQVLKKQDELQEVEFKLTNYKKDYQELVQENQQLKKQVKEKEKEIDDLNLNFKSVSQKQQDLLEKNLESKIKEISLAKSELEQKCLQQDKEIMLKDQKIKLLEQEIKKFENLLKKIDKEKNQTNLLKTRSVSLDEYEQLQVKVKEMEKYQSEFKIKEMYLQDQLSIQKNNYEEIKNLYEKVFTSISPQRLEKETLNADLLQTNKNLTQMLSKSQNKIKVLEEKVGYYKQFKEMVQLSKTLKCQKCQRDFTSQFFLEHSEKCDFESSLIQQNQIGNYQTPQESPLMMLTKEKLPNSIIETNDLFVRIDDFQVNNQNKEKIFMEYIIKVFLENKQWTVKKKYVAFSQLYTELSESYPNVKLPDSGNSLKSFYLDISKLGKKNFLSDDRKKLLEKFLNDLLKIQTFRTSSILKEFLNLPDEIPEKENSFLKTAQNLKSEAVSQQINQDNIFPSGNKDFPNDSDFNQDFQNLKKILSQKKEKKDTFQSSFRNNFY